MSSISTPRENHILAALPDADYVRMLPHLEQVSMPVESVVYEADRPLGYLYFPTTCIISLFHVLESGASAEFAVTGNEGMVGISLFMGGTSMPSEARVQIAGSAYRLKTNILKRELTLNCKLQHLGLRYIQILITHMAQTAVCNRHHNLEQQLCRWLLLRLDRLPNSDLTITQEQIANDLGVRRESVTEAAGKLQWERLIQYKRGHISVLDRKKLENRVCECYALQKREFDRLLA
ncbi:MAG: Crp/Fnr family transcriptional regulator [Rugosibacter sp.]|nr:Crp/Fnr family transcriptional regulator [Rugosibacter sp.]